MSEMRNRRSEHIQNTVRSGMSRLENVMSDSAFKFRSMPSRGKVLFALSAVLSLTFYIYLAKHIFQRDPETYHESLLETEKCPACYGGSACSMIYYKQIEFTGSSKYRVLDLLNGKNVHFGIMQPGSQDVVLKKLATDIELRDLDKKLCKDAMRPEECDIARVITRTNMAIPVRQEPITPIILKKTGAFMFTCPSYRLVDRIWSYFQEYKKKEEIFISDKMQILYTSLVNPEPIILQTFPKREGWPFPAYIGSCGRVIVEEYAGKPLSDFVHTSFQLRAGLAYELLKIAETLTTKSDFALYITDVSIENFAVDASGKVSVIDLENIIVVDKLAIEARKPPGWKEPHEALFSDCEGKNCLEFSREDLCGHLRSDHNYNAICRNILSHYAKESNMPEGLLHSMPIEAKDYWDLGNLLEECARPTQKEGRWKVKDKIMQALEALMNERKDHLNIKNTLKRGRELDQS